MLIILSDRGSSDVHKVVKTHFKSMNVQTITMTGRLCLSSVFVVLTIKMLFKLQNNLSLYLSSLPKSNNVLLLFSIICLAKLNLCCFPDRTNSSIF